MFPFKFRSTIVMSLLHYINKNKMEICCVHVKMLVICFSSDAGRSDRKTKKRLLLFLQVQLRDTLVYHQAEGLKIII